MSPRLRAQFDDYATFHGTPGNQACHYVAVPLIVLTLFAMLAQVEIATVAGFTVTLAEVVIVLATAYYLTLDVSLALQMLAASVLLAWAGRFIPPLVALSLFAAAWALQFVGHYVYEHRSPAFFRNLTHLLVGPLWVLAKATRRAAVVLLAIGLAACGGATEPTPLPSSSPGASCEATPVTGTPQLTSVRVASGLLAPVDLQSAPGDRARLFVVEQGGRIRIVRGGAVVAAPFLDIASRISTEGERGLLGLAFHPAFATNGRFFVNYTDPNGHTHIAEFRAAAGADSADPASERLILFVTQPFANHNGGGLGFGNDGMLYIALGDGGSGGDPLGNGQSLATHLGKILRVDVDRASPFAIPPDNPFVANAAALPAIWAYGLRNPWRFGFDRATGDLYIGDVGQNALEEVDVGLAARRGGENYGWSIMEGSRCFRPASGCPTAGLTLPVVEYGRGDGCSITGGVVYRGCRTPGYQGTYFYGDYCTGMIRSFRFVNGQALDQRDWTAALGRGIGNISSFGVNADGEIHIVDHDGEVYRVEPAP